jgi:hypothetical protein
MKALAAFVMRGRMPAAAVATTLAMLALLVTPLAIASTAVICLVALRQGVRDGALVSLIALFALGAFGAVLFGQPLALIGVGLGLWLPALALGATLRTWQSLGFTVGVIVLAGFGLVLAQYLFVAHPVAFWGDMMREFLSQVTDPATLGKDESEAVIAALAPWMVGGLAAAWTLQLALSLFLARAWQAQLYNPGGFKAEFHALRLGRWLLYLVPVLLIASLLIEGPGLPAQLSLVGMTGFFLQGVSLVHALTATLKAGAGWLIGFYMMLFFTLPHSFTVISAAGFADGWLDFRARLRARAGRGGNKE